MVLASDGRDSPRGRRARFPAYDLTMTETGALDAPYPTNIPWPTVVDLEGQSLLIGFNGAAYGGRLVGYGSHGDVVIQRARTPLSR